MKLDLVFGNETITLPASVASHLEEAAELDLRVLFALASDAALRADYSAEKLAVALDAPPREIDASVAFWRGAGVLHASGKGSKTRAAADTKEKKETSENAGAKAEKDAIVPGDTQAVRVLRADSLPVYTGVECERILEKRPALREVIDEAQRIFEKTFSASDINTVIALADHLGLSDEYILLLFSHLKGEGKASMRTLKTTALRLFDEGKVSVEALEEYIARLEEKKDFMSKIEALVLDGRKLSERQKAMCESWQSFGFEFEVFSLAYQRALDREAKTIFPYMNGILENWHEAGLTTVAQIKEYEEAGKQSKQKQKKNSAEPTDHSFDADEFFRIAEDYSKSGEGTK